MSGFAVVSIEDKFNGNKGRVLRDGAMRGVPGIGETQNQGPALTTTPVKLLPKNESRRQIQLQNKDPGIAVFIRLDDNTGGGAPYRIDAGVTYSFPAGVTYTGEIWAWAASNGAEIALIEFNEPDEDMA